MMVSMPFQLLHYDFVLGTDGEVEEEVGEDDEAWMFFTPSSYPSEKTRNHANSYWKIDGNQLHKHDLKSYIDLEEDSWMFFNPSAIPSKEAYLNAKCSIESEENQPAESSAIELQEDEKRKYGRTHAGYGVSYTEYVTKQLMDANEESLKALQTFDIGFMQFSLSQVYYAIYLKDDADDMSQKIKLQICKKCLDTKSVTMELKLWCIKQLSDLVKMRIEQTNELRKDTKDKERKKLLK